MKRDGLLHSTSSYSDDIDMDRLEVSWFHRLRDVAETSYLVILILYFTGRCPGKTWGA